MPMTIDHAVRWWAREYPDRPALRFAEHGLSYAALQGWVGRVAADLVRRGMAQGDRVVLIGENSIEICVAMLAIMRGGGVSAALRSSMITPPRWS
jgi:acyl-CoA synthetase (AMP-forming)/AMP-acid ligase II